MKTILIKYYSGHPIQMEEIVKLLEEYMNHTGKKNPVLLQTILSPNNPFRNDMINKAVQVSADYLSSLYTITRVFSKEGNLLMVY
jgi:hypothetical protein